MKWNNGKERAKFEREQAELREQYLAAGMTEEQIQIMYDFDNDFFNERRREAEHTQELDIQAFDDDSSEDELKSSLLDKFMDNLSITDSHFQNERFGWIEQIEDESISKALKKLPDDYKELLTLIVCDGLNQSEVAEKFDVSHQAISKKIKKIKKIFRKVVAKMTFSSATP